MIKNGYKLKGKALSEYSRESLNAPPHINESVDDKAVEGVTFRDSPRLFSWSVLQLHHYLLEVRVLSDIHSVATLATNGNVGDLSNLILEYKLVQVSSQLHHETKALLSWVFYVQPLGYHWDATHLVLHHGHIVEEEMLYSLTGWNIVRVAEEVGYLDLCLLASG